MLPCLAWREVLGALAVDSSREYQRSTGYLLRAHDMYVLLRVQRGGALIILVIVFKQYQRIQSLFTVLCLTGSLAFVAWLVPIEAGMAIVLWIGIMMAAQSFEATPRHHAPAVVMGLLPGLGAWGVLMAKDGLRARATRHSRRSLWQK